MVGRERRGGRHAASGASRRETPVYPVPTLSDPTHVLVDSEGRGRLGRPPTPQAPQSRGAQRGLRERRERGQGSRSPRNGVSRTVFTWSRDAERPRAFAVFGARPTEPVVTPVPIQESIYQLPDYRPRWILKMSVVKCAGGLEEIPNGLHEGSVALEVVERIVDDVVIDDVAVGVGQYVPEPCALCHLFGQ